MDLSEVQASGIIEVLNELSTPNLADAMDGLDIECKWLSRRFETMNVKPFIGFADTVEWGATRKSKDIKEPSPSTWEEVSSFIKDIETGTVPWVYVSGCREISTDFVLAGGLSISYMNRRGYVGAIFNGSIRDIEELEELDITLWYSNVGILDSQGCMSIKSRKSGCIVNGSYVNQGDVIVGDRNGVVAINQHDVERIAQQARIISAKESAAMAAINNGENLYDLIEKGGHI